MIQIGLLIAAAGCCWAGFRGIMGWDPKTKTPVAIAALVLGLALAGFALIGLPLLLQML